jgi:tripartite-type tricarboxylate transporter receptor subunit TctC
MNAKLMAFLLSLLTGMGLATAAQSLAAYPDRPISIIVPLPPGGPADTVARIVGQKLQERLGQPVTIDNRPGALGLIGAEIGAHAKPDGYSIVMVSSGLGIQVATQPKTIHFDVHKDLQPITYAVKVPMVIAANPSAPFKTLREFVEYAKARPGTLSVGVSPGLGGTAHLTLERMKLGVGLDVVAVPYKGSAPAIQALLSNEVPVIIDTLAGSSGLIDDGKIRALATLTEGPVVGHEQIPTVAAAGFPGYDADTWNGFMVPGGTPRDIVDLLHKQITAILDLPEVKEKIFAVGLEPATNTPEQFSESFNRGIALWTKVASDAKLTFD